MDEHLLQRYSVLMSQRQHQDRLFWSRVQTLYVIQAGVLGGSYAIALKAHGPLKTTLEALRLCDFAVGLLLLGVVLTMMIGLLCCYDWQDFRVNESRLFSLGDRIGISQGVKHTGIRRWLPGNRVLNLSVIGFAVIDLAVAFAYYPTCKGGPSPAIILAHVLLSAIVVGGSYPFWCYWGKPIQKPGGKGLSHKGEDQGRQGEEAP